MATSKQIPVSKLEWEKDSHVEEAIQSIKQQEELLRLRSFDAEIAHDIGEATRQAIRTRHPNDGTSALISIRLWNGLTLYQSTVGAGVTPSNEDWARRKANTVRVHGKSSFLVGRELVKKGRDINSLGADFAAHGGAFPIRLAGVETGPIGTIIVSGMTQSEDHAVITDALKAFVQ